MNRYELLVSRVRAPLANGYMDQPTAFRQLVSDGISPNVAYLAVKGAVVLNKLQGGATPV
jgi:hypothetical protein